MLWERAEEFLSNLIDPLEAVTEDQMRQVLNNCKHDLIASVQALWTEFIVSLWDRYRHRCLERLAHVPEADALFDPVQAKINSDDFALEARRQANDMSIAVVKKVVSLADIEVPQYDGHVLLLDFKARLRDELVDISHVWWMQIAVIGNEITNCVKAHVFSRPAGEQPPELMSTATTVVSLCNSAKGIARKMTKKGKALGQRDLLFALPTFTAEPATLPAKALIDRPPSGKGHRLSIKVVDVVSHNQFIGEAWANRVATATLPQLNEAGDKIVVELELCNSMDEVLGCYGTLLATEPESTLDLIVTLALPAMEHIPLKLADMVRVPHADAAVPVKAFQILIADEPTAKKIARTFFANPEEHTPPKPLGQVVAPADNRECLLLVVKTGGNLLPPQALVDYSKLVGEHFSKRLATDDATAPRYFRMENDIVMCYQTTSAVSDVPSTIPRAMMGLRKLLAWEEKEQKRRRVASMVRRWKADPAAEVGRLTQECALTDGGLQFFMMASQLGSPPKNEGECRAMMDDIEKSMGSEAFPQTLRRRIEAELSVQIVSVSMLHHSHACHYVANHSAETLQKNSEDYVRSNYAVEVYKSGSSSYRQTALVLVNTEAQSPDVWVPTTKGYNFAKLSKQLIALSKPGEVKDFSKMQRKAYTTAEGQLAAHTLKLKHQGKIVASGATCIVTDEFTVELKKTPILDIADDLDDDDGDGDDDNDDNDDTAMGTTARHPGKQAKRKMASPKSVSGDGKAQHSSKSAKVSEPAKRKSGGSGGSKGPKSGKRF